MTATNIFNVVYQSGSDGADEVASSKALADSVGPYTVQRWATSGARDTGLGTVGGPQAGMFAYHLDSKTFGFYDAANWRPLGPYAMSAGTVSVTVTAAATGTAAVVFPSSPARFTVTPVVTISLVDPASGSARLVPRVTSPTASGFTATVLTGDGSTTTATVTLNWTAIQMTGSAAAG